MVLPLLPIIAAAGLATSGQANLYSQQNQRRIYRDQAKAYGNLDKGYRSYLQKHGRQVNPNRAWTSYYGAYRSAQNNLENSYLGSVGTIGGSVGAGAFASRSLYREMGHTSRWL